MKSIVMKKYRYLTYGILLASILMLPLSEGCSDISVEDEKIAPVQTEDTYVPIVSITDTSTPTPTITANDLTEEEPIPSEDMNPPNPSVPETVRSRNPLQNIVDDFRALQPKEIPAHMYEGNSGKEPGDFDISSYFSVLTHLFIEPGYVLDYVYMGDMSFGGRPLIYVRRADAKPFTSFEEYLTAREAVEGSVEISDRYEMIGFVMEGDTSELENKVRIDGTPEGFFEFVVLQMLGGQFYLSWHANYDDVRIICDKDSLERTLDESLESLGSDIMALTRSGGNMSRSELLAKAVHIDFQPVVTISDDTAVVKVFVFTKWGGFIQITFTITKNYPHTIVKVTQRTIIDYQCGVSF